ncbi:MAG: hypothetical protein HRT45_05110 [Bdellovibrionales bacterium]|nr:hypothetical protein [Bdellovibrionales bacterium]
MGKSVLQDIQTTFKDNLLYIIGTSLGCVFVTILSFTPELFNLDQSNSKSSGNTEIDKQVNAMVNQNLQSDQSLIDFRARKVKADNQASRKGADNNFDPDVLSEKRYEMIDPRVHDGSSEVYEDIFGSGNVYDSHMNPSDRIEAKIHRMKVLDRYDYQQKLAFIETFVQNAYEQGYQVEINEDLEVTEVKRINNKEPYRGTATLDKLLDRQGY